MGKGRHAYWHGKNVFITGINGFIGGNLARHMLGLGARVTGLVRNDKKDSYLYFEKLDRRATIIHGDITDKELLKRIIVEEQIQCVFHLAAQVEVGVARAYPYLTFETNVKGTYALLEAIRNAGQWETNVKGTYALLEAIRGNAEQMESVVIASSDKAYGSYPENEMPYREHYPLIPIFPYDVSKACGDMIARSYASPLFGIPIVVTRFCNIYGPGQLNYSALIPDAIRCALGYNEFIPRGNGMQIRDYIYVGDVVDLYAVIGEGLSKNRSLAGEVFNAGTKQPKRVKDILKKVYVFLGRTGKYKKIEKLFAKKKTVGEIDVQYMDYDKVYKTFGWKPKTSFDKGLKETIQWFKKYLKKLYAT